MIWSIYSEADSRVVSVFSLTGSVNSKIISNDYLVNDIIRTKTRGRDGTKTREKDEKSTRAKTRERKKIERKKEGSTSKN